MDLFAATPPLETIKFLISLSCSGKTKGGRRKKIMADDVRRAYFHAKATREVYVEIP